MTIAITGATGQLGRLVVDQLKGRVAAGRIVALVRSPEKAADLQRAGIAVRAFDYNDPATLAPGLAGVDTLLLISSSEVGQRIEQHRRVIDAARQAGVRRIVYTSVLHADTSTLDIADEHRATEADLKASGVAWTVARHGWYTENYAGSIAGALATGTVIGAAGEGRISSATRADFAAADVAVLLGIGHEGQTYELAGDEAWTLGDLAAELSRQTGRMIAFQNLSADAYARALAGAGVPEGFAHAIASYDVRTAAGALFDDSRTLSRLIGRPTTPLAAFVADALRGQSA